MKKRIILVIIVVFVMFVCFKTIMLIKYKYEKKDIDNSMIFSETLTINHSIDFDGEFLTIDNMSIANYFTDYVDTLASFKVKYDKDNNVESFYSIGSMNQYINLLNEKNMQIDEDNDDTIASVDESTKAYLDGHNIKNDIDLLNHIKNNYYFKNKLFTCTKKMKINHLFNMFVNVSLLDFKSIILINGYIDGYIINTKNEERTIKEIHLLNNNKQYIIVLGGNDITNNEFIVKLLSSISFN